MGDSPDHTPGPEPRGWRRPAARPRSGRPQVIDGGLRTARGSLRGHSGVDALAALARGGKAPYRCNMTLILTMANDDYRVLVSDRRLTRNGELCDDESNKAAILICEDAGSPSPLRVLLNTDPS